MGYKQRRSVTATPLSSSVSLDGKRFGNDPEIVQDPERIFFSANFSGISDHLLPLQGRWPEGFFSRW